MIHLSCSLVKQFCIFSGCLCLCDAVNQFLELCQPMLLLSYLGELMFLIWKKKRIQLAGSLNLGFMVDSHELLLQLSN
ncbi:hypothetical protein E1A91_A02G098700v1 [Gossypium mustelinum]|uniref:Uncharacterized protein n=1 Tax=Gossypium mustelinum TaxID=34275 RepID=A0A5D3A7E6_GOSMU|nr:hypothetical protein E1A91_A02G098700v1 [Gossypium mustelinum]